MPAYAFEIRWDGGERISWTYLPTDESARKFAQILAQNFKVGDQYRGAGRLNPILAPHVTSGSGTGTVVGKAAGQPPS
jgi:hypothetical protein